MQRKTYDLAIGLGMACSCSQTLREAKLQFMSFPFDWVALTANDQAHYAGDMPRRAKELADGFSTWFGKEDFKRCESRLANGKDTYVCDRLGLIFQHDFPAGMPYDQAFPLVSAKYRRRINRLMSYLQNAKRILILRVDRPDLPFGTATDDLVAAQAILRNAFAGRTFDIFHLAFEKGRSFQDRATETPAPGITRVTFDYKDTTPGCAAYNVNTSLTSAFLHSLFSVPDYRTPEDRRSFNRERRRNRYRKLGADNWLDYQLKRLKHFLSR